MMAVLYPVYDACRDDGTGRQSGEYLHAEPFPGFGVHLHIHLAEYLREELHAVEVIDRKEFVIVLLADFMADDLPVNDGGHPVLALALCRMDGDFAHFHFTPVPSFLVPASVPVEIIEVSSVNDGSFRYLSGMKFLLSFKELLLLLLPLCQFFFHFRMQADVDAPVAVKGFHCHLVPVVRSDDVVDKFDALLHRMFLDRIGGKYRCLFFCKVIDKIGGNRLRLDGQRPFFRIHDKAVRRKAFLPLFVGEVHG